MANYITRPAIDRRVGKTDIEQLMPYLQNELATVRTNDNAKIATLQEIERNALADPEGFKGTKFHIDNSGFLNMNEKAKNLARLEGEEGYDQTAISNSETLLDTELTDQVNQANFDRINNTAERNAARAENAELGSIDKTKLAELGMNQQNAQGQSIIGDKGIANTTPPPTKPAEGTVATPTNTPTSIDAAVDKYASGGTGTDPFASSLGGTAKPDAYDSAFSNLQNGTTSPQPATGTIATSTQPDPNVLKTGTAAEKANELAKQNPGMSAKVTESDMKSQSSGEKANYTIKTDMGVGESTFENDMIKTKTTETRAGIIDQDKTTLKSLKRAAGIERLGNMAMAGRPGATQANTMANRLAAREAFLTDIQGKYGVTAKTKEQSGGNSKIKLGNINAGFTVTSGAATQNSVTTNVKTGGAVIDNRGAADPNEGVYSFEGSRYTAGGEMKLVGGLVTNTGSADIHPAINASHKSTLEYKNRDRIAKAPVSNGYKYVTDVDTGLQFRVNAKTGKSENWVIKPGQGFKETDAPRVAGIGRGMHTQNVNEVKSTLIAKPPKGREKDYREVRDENNKLLGYEEL